ncbi:hypothetical protein GOP47_0000826 [Adiantum capillus-veneris]|uniref:Uncharacterized protein n=1 Tax=Adiantum capillus-veneris TaxID=13818 RepID=A0A9D4VFV3_ADICA|nr:hypothetical protein GOP47_0000826 [Adiantum capillus-veneris]
MALLLFHVLWAQALLALLLQSSSALVVDQSKLLGHCSTVCESRFCSVTPLLRYGKYCGVQYSGCPGQDPCDDLDTCCKIHDDCIGNIENYLNKTCNHNLLECVEAYKASGNNASKVAKMPH